MINWIRKLFGINNDRPSLWDGPYLEEVPEAPEGQDVKKLIASFRGEPSKCDFCGWEKTLDELHPEEGGDWICLPCLDRCEAAEGQNP